MALTRQMSRGEDLREHDSENALFRLQPKDLAVVDKIIKLHISLLRHEYHTRVNLIFVLVFNIWLMATFHMMTIMMKMKMMSNWPSFWDVVMRTDGAYRTIRWMLADLRSKINIIISNFIIIIIVIIFSFCHTHCFVTCVTYLRCLMLNKWKYCCGAFSEKRPCFNMKDLRLSFIIWQQELLPLAERWQLKWCWNVFRLQEALSWSARFAQARDRLRRASRSAIIGDD